VAGECLERCAGAAGSLASQPVRNCRELGEFGGVCAAVADQAEREAFLGLVAGGGV
jgi:hypothetical protein